MLSKERIDRLDELAESVKGWSNCDSAFLDNSEDDPAAVVGHIDRDGNTYPVATIDCDQYMQGGDSIKLAKFYAAANPQAVSELIAMLREAQKNEARYLWLRNPNSNTAGVTLALANDYFDDAVDAAMQRDCDGGQHAGGE